ncbi:MULTISPECIES: site-specific integrase [Luteibacter]|uniref:site-specific integrase n=1 Tax=Luteibacter TaxID=242605 RepID=UPI00055E03E2|nr:MULTISPECIES: site-specific integrase [unclassified Luteibacter]
MRLPHHLVRHPSGVYHFRLLVPADLRTAFGLKVIKQSLRTRSLAVAQGWSYVLSARYAQAFADSREQWGAMGNHRDDLRMAKFEIRRGADGAFAMSTNGTPEDNTAALAALGLMVAHTAPMAGATGLRSGPSKAPTLGMAIRSYAQIEAPNLKPNTWEQRRRNFELFLKAVGGGRTVDSITRPMAAAWADDLQRSGLSKRYVANCVSHVAQLFEVQIRAGHIPKGENPVKGLVVLKAKEKRDLRAKGQAWEAFDETTLKRIFHPETYVSMRGDHLRWAPLIGLYTGARVSEIAQLHLRDFEEVDGIKCALIRADSDGQSLKTAASERLVPIHPDLLALGLWDRVLRLREEGHMRLFPDMRIDSRAGAGNAVTKGFSYYLGKIQVSARREAGIVGFHSLRKTVIQTLQPTTLSSERRRALVGHEPGEDVHSGDYMRPWTATELAAFFPELKWSVWLDIPSMRAALGR